MRTETALTAHRVVRAAELAGLDPAPLCRILGVEPAHLADFERRIPLDLVYAMWEEVMRALRKPSFPIEAGAIPPTESKSPLTFLSRSCATMREASVHLVRYWATATDDHTLRIDETEDDFTIVFDGASFHRLGARCNIELGLAAFVHGARAITDDRLKPRLVTFRHPAPPDVTAHAACFGTVEFSAPRVSLVFSAANADEPLGTAVPGLAAYLERHMASIAARLSLRTPDTVRVRAAIVEDIREGRTPSRARAATRLRMSLRTLNRRLAEEGTTFHRVVDETRRDLAEELLAGRTHAVKEIADLLAFADVRSFHRAYRRWTGKTPRARREA
jgi:AraC-like DNA-binding protein